MLIPYRLLALPCLLASATLAFGLPSVTNVAFTQSGATAAIAYDLVSANGACTVSVLVSTNNGATFPVVATGLTGDVGLGVVAGVGKSASWNVGAQFLNQVLPTVVLRVVAQDSTGVITVANHSFETNPQVATVLQITTPAGWQAYNGANLNGSSNVIGWGNLTTTGHFSTFPDGNNIGICFLGGSPNGEAGMEQTIGSAIMVANALYTLTTEIGNINEGTAAFGYFDLRGFPGYRVELRSGATLIGSDVNGLAGSIPDGEWRTSVVRAVTSSTTGSPVTIRLVNLDAPPPGEELAREVNFDNVRLTVAGFGTSAPGAINTTSTQVVGWEFSEN